MGLNMIVLVKQVPDTHNITCDAMKPDGTVNRSALPAVFNPEDLNALEEALKIKDRAGGHITAVSMGPPSAQDVLKQCLYRGADEVILISDRRFAGADTLATSYALKCAIEKIKTYDLVFSGRQAIDGDTAQVGPQVAEKLGINQICYVKEIVETTKDSITAIRSVDNGTETVKSGFPVLLTVTGEANTPRSPSVKKALAYKNVGKQQCDGSYFNAYLDPSACNSEKTIREWNVESIEADPDICGLSGSPTKVKKVENVVLEAQNTRQIPADEEGISALVQELVQDHIIG